MSSDEEFEYQDFGDDDDEVYIPSDDDDAYNAPVAAPAPAPARRSAHQPPPAPLNHFQQAQQYVNPGAFQAGFGGHAFARPPAGAFRKSYKAYSTAILEVQQGRSYGGGRSNLMYGGKIVMPPSALHELTQMDIELPITFEISNPIDENLNTHVGVLEFIADEGTVNLPQWVMDQLRLNEGDPIRIVGARFPKGKLIKIQPQSPDFIEISDPKSVLEQALRNFSCLSAGDIIEIGYHSLTFRLLIMEITPPGPAISVLDTDLEVDFATPLGYVEPDYKKLSQPAPTMKDKFVIDTKGMQDVDARGSGSNTPVPGGSGTATPSGWEAFKGSGASLGGKRIKGKGVSVKKIEAVDAGSRIIRTDQPRIITADTQIGGRQVPAALNLPFGNLFFGFENQRPPPGSAAEAAEIAAAASTAAAPFAGVGNGNTLSGRARSQASTPSGAPPATTPPIRAPEVKPSVPFSGQGQSLSGKKPIETIEID
ncbi:ubiquitin fusion degradation protein 1 [Pseudohyphozyma bogoriensis]|nr:ubiquitin fusion degradation protein 1 [Pseudohyphozyma bogoriensis]